MSMEVKVEEMVVEGEEMLLSEPLHKAMMIT